MTHTTDKKKTKRTRRSQAKRSNKKNATKKESQFFSATSDKTTIKIAGVHETVAPSTTDKSGPTTKSPTRKNKSKKRHRK